MKRIFFAVALIAASSSMLPMNAIAAADDDDKDTGVVLNKYVSGPDDNGQYTITLEAFATGSSITTRTEEIQPNDIVIVMDYSSSMTNYSIDTKEKDAQVSSGSALSSGTNYIIIKDGKEYFLKGFQEASYTYSARNSQGYSYYSYGNNSYYYKDGDEYYQVMRDRSYDFPSGFYYFLYYTKNNTNYYLYGTAVTSTRPTKVTKNSDTIWTGILYEQKTTYDYYYRYSNTVPASVTDGTEFYKGSTNYTVQATDNIYTVKSSSKTRLAVAQEAACTFIETVYNNRPPQTESGEPQYHNLAVVRFDKNDNAAELVSFQPVDGDSYQKMQTTVKNYNTVANGTHPEDGLALAKTIFNRENVNDDGRNKVVVFFTDGMPGDSWPPKFDAKVARDAVKEANAIKSDTAKEEGKKPINATIFSIAVLSDEDRQNQNMLNFLHYVSSNYKSVTVGTNSPSFTELSATSNPDMWPRDKMQTSDGSDLSAIFDAIAHEASEGGSTKKLDSETTTVVDVLTADFVLPEGTDESKIGLFVESVTGHSLIDGKDVYTFGNRVNLVPSGKNREDYVSFANATTSDGKATKKIVVTGFDFTKDDKKDGNAIVWTDAGEVEVPGNWVGPRILGIGSTPKYYGRRLVITIPIEPAPDYQGGYSLPTNTAESGLYSKGSDTPVDVFPVPNLDFPSIGLIKYGLKKGESATFSVQRIKDEKGTAVSEAAFNIILTGSSADGSAPAYTVLKDLKEGTYRVAESKWSWTYNVTEVTVKDGEGSATITPGDGEASASTQVLAKSQTVDWPSDIDETAKCVLFTFTNEKKSGDDNTIYAESVVKNQFKGGSVTTTGNVTTNSKAQQ